MDFIKTIKDNAYAYASMPFWSWNDKLEEEELRRQIQDMKRLGMSGFFMHARCGLETDYMSDEWFDCIMKRDIRPYLYLIILVPIISVSWEI